MADLAALQSMTARFEPVDITADVSVLPPHERRALAKLVDASRVMDALFLRQTWGGAEAMLASLQQDQSPIGRACLRYFLINKGPWSRLDHNAPFVPGAPAKPASANFYPGDASKDDVATWIAGLSADAKADAVSFFTTIRRGANGSFAAVPYSVEYKAELDRAAALLRDAAALTTQPTLAAFLRARAAAFSSNDYYASDVAWMEIDASIEPTIGPYEVYEDEWFNYKAAFEAFVTLRDDVETRKLDGFSGRLQDIENHLPIDPRYRNPTLGALAPIAVVNVVFAAGDGNRGVQTAAFNLPNDERVVRQKGAKRVMLKNVQEAKFAKALQPIAERTLAPADRADVSFDAFFTHILMHELMHGLGQHQITVGGRATTVRQELRETYSAIEEIKADVSGLWALQYLADAGAIDASIARCMYTTFLASIFRTIRFGVNEAHGRSVALQLNYLLDAGAFIAHDNGTFSVDRRTIAEATKALTGDIITLQAEGDYTKATDLLARLAVVRPPVQKALDRLVGIPVDIEPRYVAADALQSEAN